MPSLKTFLDSRHVMQCRKQFFVLQWNLFELWRLHLDELKWRIRRLVGLD